METRLKYKALIDRYHRYVFAICLRILANHSEAEDATQEVYERAWKHIGKLSGSEAKAWLAKVSRNICIDRLRAKKPEASIETKSDELSLELSSPSESIEAQQISQWLMNAINRLREPYKSIVLLSDIQQKPNKEVAQTIGLNENQIKVYGYRARQQLKSLLQGSRHLHEVEK